MMLVTQIHLGTNHIADGTMLLEDAARQGGFVMDGSMCERELTKSIAQLKKLLADLEQVRAALRENDKPVMLQAAE